jgi:hypothetical protein
LISSLLVNLVGHLNCFVIVAEELHFGRAAGNASGRPVSEAAGWGRGTAELLTLPEPMGLQNPDSGGDLLVFRRDHAVVGQAGSP